MTQEQCLLYLQKHKDEPVLVRQISEHYNLNPNTVNRCLRQLEKFGLVVRQTKQIGSYNYYVYSVPEKQNNVSK
jgi:predicted transcriptional regulator